MLYIIDCAQCKVIILETVKNMDDIIERGRLYDYYGAMLTEHQRQIYEALVYNDMSLSEIAGEYDISRQGVHDLILRCDRQLKRFEERLRHIERDRAISAKLDEIDSMTKDDEVAKLLDEIRDLL